MKKNSKIFLSLLFVLVILMFMTVGKANANNIGIYSGPTFNSFNLTDINKIATDYGSEELKFGIGYYGGINYRTNEKISLGSELDFIQSDWKTLVGDIHSNSIGVLGTISYNLPTEIFELKIKGGIGQYFSEIESNINDIEDGEESNIGYKVGFEGDIKINSKSSLNIRTMYRNNNVEFSNVNLNYSGIEFNTGMKIKF